MSDHYFLPERLRPWQHAVLAAGAVTTLVTMGFVGVRHHQAILAAQGAEFQALEKRVLDVKTQSVTVASADFTHALPSSAAHDEVVRDIGRSAQKLGFLIASLTIQKQPATANELGSIQFTIAAKAEYQVTKTWLAELLSRYPTLALQNLSVRAMPNETAKQEVRAVLALFVKD